MNLDEFQALLFNLRQNDNQIRQQATEIYNKFMLENPSGLIFMHIQNITTSKSEPLIAMSIILLKVLFKFNDGNLLNFVNEEVFSLIDTTFPTLFENTQFTPYIFSQLADTISYIAKVLIPRQYLLTFVPHLFQIIQSGPQLLWIPSMSCITQCNNYIPLVNNSIISFEAVFALLAATLQSDNFELISAALRILYSFYLNNESCSELSGFASSLTQLYTQIPEPNQNSTFSDLYLFCTQSSNFFASVLTDFIASLLSIKGGPQVQMIIVDIFVCLAKSFDVSFNPFLRNVTTAILLASVNFDENEIDEDDIELSAPSSDVAIFHFSELFSNRTEYPNVVIKLVSDMIQNLEWTYRRSALSALYELLLSCNTNLEAYCNDIFQLLLPCLADQHHICRYYAFRALIYLAESYMFYIEEHASNLFELILTVVYSEIYYPTKIVELKALSAICTSTKSAILTPLSGSIIEKIIPLLQSPNVQPLEQLIVIECIATVAVSSRIDFQPFYQDSINCLKTALTQIQSQEKNSIRIQAIKAYPLIGKCVPSEVFIKDAIDFIEFVIQSNFNGWCDDEKIVVLSTLDKLIHILPKDVYTQYLSTLLEIFCNFLLSDFDTEELPIFIDVSSLTDKVTVVLQAANMTIAYSRSQLQFFAKCTETLKNHIEIFNVLDSPLIYHISKIAIKFVSFSAYPLLQIMAIELLQSLFVIFSKNDKANCAEYVKFINEQLINVLSLFFSNSSLVISAIFDFLSVINDNELSLLEMIFNLTTQYLAHIHVKRQEISEKGAGENSSKLVLLNQIEISIERCAKIFLVNIDERIVTFLLQSPCHVFRLLFMTDLFNKAPESGFVKPELLFMSIEHSLDSDDCIVAYAAFISLARLILNQKVEQGFMHASIEKAVLFINQYDDDENDSIHQVIDGALISMAAFFSMFPESDIVGQILPLWFKEMPITYDSPDANIAYDLLIHFAAQKHPIIFNPQSIAHLLKVYFSVIMGHQVRNEIKEFMKDHIHNLMTTEETRAIIEDAFLEIGIDVRDYIKNCF